MAKKKAATRHRMTKLEKFYIDHHPDSDAKSLAIELGIPEAVIDRYQKKMKREQKKEEQEQKEKPTTTDDFMIKKEDYGVVVMTEAASQQGDASRGAGLKSKYYNNAVKKIR
tara:strand:- start:283 stop:618 length:336 start_codon:yes stop_codon:yes gene_type:complete